MEQKLYCDAYRMGHYRGLLQGLKIFLEQPYSDLELTRQQVLDYVNKEIAWQDNQIRLEKQLNKEQLNKEQQ